MLGSFIEPLVLCHLILVPMPREPEPSDKGFGFLGVAYVNEVEGTSIRITDIYDDTPAKRGGLQPNDLILSLNGKKVTNTDLFTKTIVRSRPGTVVELEVQRNNTQVKLKVKLGIRPESFPHPFPEIEEAPLMKKEE
jgi:S1-C subfamily serine protease